MARLSIADIPQYAAEIILKHQREAPVRVGAIAQDLGVSVLVSDLPLSISGSLSRDKADRKKWLIRVNRHEHRNRQRFTIAHEVSHFILHREAISDEVIDDTLYRSGLSERREFEANALAAEILMPWTLINALLQRFGASISTMATMLQVSEAALKIRIGSPT